MDKTEKYIYHRGDIVYVNDLPATGGHELCGNRPAVVISSNHLNRYSDVLIVVLLTSSNVSPSPVHVPVPSKSETSVAKCEQPKSIDRKFITVPIGHKRLLLPPEGWNIQRKLINQDTITIIVITRTESSKEHIDMNTTTIQRNRFRQIQHQD